VQLLFFFFVGVVLSFGFNLWRLMGFTACVMAGHALWQVSQSTPFLAAIGSMLALTTALQIGYFAGLLGFYCRARLLDRSRAAATRDNVGRTHRSA
jgi:hypothetical protein